MSALADFTVRVLDIAERRGCTVADLRPSEIEYHWNDMLASPRLSSNVRSAISGVVSELRAVNHALGGCEGTELLDVLHWIVNDTAGGGYGLPACEVHVREFAARYLLRSIAEPRHQPLPAINFDSVALVSGANEGIGALFRLLAGVGYLQPGDVVGMLEPVYSPYLKIARDKLHCRVLTLPTTADHSWDVASSDILAFEQKLRRARAPLKVFCLVNPNNPTSRCLSQDGVERLAKMLRAHGCVVIEDVVYHEFVPRGNFHSLWAHMPDQSILVYSMSKYYRVTGSRFGFVVVTDEANARLGGTILRLDHGSRSEYGESARTIDFRGHISLAKGPGPGGALEHTAHVPKAMQLQAVVRLLVDYEGGVAFTRALQDRWVAFYHHLGLLTPHEVSIRRGDDAEFVPYYVLLDLLDLVRAIAPRDWRYANLAQALESGHFRPDDVFLRGLPMRGVSVLPAARFYGEPHAHRWAFRFSVANQPLPRVIEAAERINAYLTELAVTCSGPLGGARVS